MYVHLLYNKLDITCQKRKDGLFNEGSWNNGLIIIWKEMELNSFTLYIYEKSIWSKLKTSFWKEKILNSLQKLLENFKINSGLCISQSSIREAEPLECGICMFVCVQKDSF